MLILLHNTSRHGAMGASSFVLTALVFLIFCLIAESHPFNFKLHRRSKLYRPICPSVCKSQHKAGQQCSKPRYKNKCSIVPCGKAGSGMAKCITNDRAAKVCPNKCVTRSNAQKQCGRARWAEQCAVAACSGGKSQCTEKAVEPRFVLCTFRSLSVGLLLGADGTPYRTGIRGGVSSPTFDPDTVTNCLQDNPAVAAVTDTFFDALVANACTLGSSSSVTLESDGTCTVTATNEEDIQSLNCLKGVGLDLFSPFACAVLSPQLALLSPELYPSDCAEDVRGVCSVSGLIGLLLG